MLLEKLWKALTDKRPTSALRRERSQRPSLEKLEDRTVLSTGTLLMSGLEGAQGSTVGPGGDLYVTEAVAGRITRIDARTGRGTTLASGLPTGPYAGFGGGAIDVAFLGRTAYVLVTGVGPDVLGTDVVGIYRVDSPTSFTVIADIGTWSTEHPPTTDFELPTGYQYALEPYRGGFLVTDGHHNRVLRVQLDGTITEEVAFGNIVPTGLAVRGKTVYVAEAGPVPHLPADGKVVAVGPRTQPNTVAAGAPLLVDVEFGPGNTLYALSQGTWDGVYPGDPALPKTGSLVRVNGNGTFTVVEKGLDRPTSLEFIGNTSYVVTLGGEVWKFNGGGHLTAASQPTVVTNERVAAEQSPLLLYEAIARRQSAGVDASLLHGIDQRIADLEVRQLGMASGHNIWLDDNAADWGWFVDSTSRDDLEFGLPGNQGEQDRIELLSVVMHELGDSFGHARVGIKNRSQL